MNLLLILSSLIFVSSAVQAVDEASSEKATCDKDDADADTDADDLVSCQEKKPSCVGFNPETENSLAFR